MRCGGSCGYDSDILATPSIDNHEQTACRTHAECHKSPFVRLRFIIRDSDGDGIVKRRNRLRHPDAVLPKIETGIALLVPLETHPFSVRTYCAYVKRLTETRRAYVSRYLGISETGGSGDFDEFTPSYRAFAATRQEIPGKLPPYPTYRA